MFRSNTRRVYAQGIGLCLLLLVPGCQNWSGLSRSKQLQQENERLLSDFRAQKQIAEELYARNQKLDQRLAESEKLIARMNQASGFISRSDQNFADSPSLGKTIPGRIVSNPTNSAQGPWRPVGSNDR